MSTRRTRWNHSIHFHDVVLAAIPAGARSALDVGTGDGLLAGELRAHVDEVVAIDSDRDVLTVAAREHTGIEWVHGDVMTHDFGRTFDVVAALATVHHITDLRSALVRLADLTAPGGVLVVIGLAREATLWDRVLSVAGVLQHRWFSLTRRMWEHSAPTAEPSDSYREVRRLAREALPGVRWRRFALWRYGLVWTRPPA